MSTNPRLAFGEVDRVIPSSRGRLLGLQWTYQRRVPQLPNKPAVSAKLPERPLSHPQMTAHQLIGVLEDQLRLRTSSRYKEKAKTALCSSVEVLQALGRIDVHGSRALMLNTLNEKGAISVVDTLFLKTAHILSLSSFDDRVSPNASGMSASPFVASLRKLKHIWTGSEACCVLLNAITAQLAEIATSSDLNVDILDVYDAMLILKEYQYLSAGNVLCTEALDRYGDVIFHITERKLSSALKSDSLKGMSWAYLDAAMWGAMWVQDVINKTNASQNANMHIAYTSRLNGFLDDIRGRLEADGSCGCGNYPGLASLLARTVRRLGELRAADSALRNGLLGTLVDKISTRKHSILYSPSDLADILSCFAESSLDPGLHCLLLQYCTDNLRIRASDGLLTLSGRQLEHILNKLKHLRTSSCSEVASASHRHGSDSDSEHHLLYSLFREFLEALATIVDKSPLSNSGESLYSYRTIARSIGAMLHMSDGYREVRVLQEALLRKLEASRIPSYGRNTMRPQDVGDIMRGLQHCKNNFITSSGTAALLSIVSEELDAYCSHIASGGGGVTLFSPAIISSCLHGMRSMETFTDDNISIVRSIYRILCNSWFVGAFSSLDVAMALDGFRYIPYDGNSDARGILVALTPSAKREASRFTPHQVTSCLFALHNIDVCDDGMVEFLAVMCEVLEDMHDRGVSLSPRDFTMSLLSLRFKSINEPVIKRLVDSLKSHVDNLSGPFSALDLNHIKIAVRDIKLNEGVPRLDFVDINLLPPYKSWNALRHSILRKIRADRSTIS
jgi:hypothetical protein